MKRLALIILFTFTASLTFAQIEPFFGLNKKHGIENPILNNIVAWYDFEETSGTTMVDSSPNGQDGTIGAAVTINQTMSWGKGYNFPNGTGSRIDIPDNDLFSFTNNIFSISLHVKVTNLSTSGAYVINKVDAGTQNEYSIHIDTAGRVIIRLYHNGSTTYIGNYTTNSVITENQWHHIVVVSEGNGWELKHIYVDNVDAPLSAQGSTGSGMINGTDNVSIGVQSGSGWGYFDLDQLIISTDVWDETDVDFLWNSGSGRLFSDVESVSYSPSAPPPIQEPANESFLASADYYVNSSATGSGDGTDSLSNAWTLDQLNTATLIPGDTVAFKHDDVFEGTLTINSSGNSTDDIVIGAYGSGEKPKIYGSKEITGWTVHSGNIYKATFNTDINQLFVDGERMKLARTPNSGYHTITTENSSTQFISTDLDGGIDYTGASWIGRTSAFTVCSQIVTENNNQTITIDASPELGIDVGEGFILTNKLEFLDQAGEWYYDTSINTVYLWTPNSDSPANYEVRGSTLDYGAHPNGRSYVIIRDIDFKHAAIAGIQVDGCDHVTIDNNTIDAAEQWGIHVPNSGSTNTTIINNNINLANYCGIMAKAHGTSITYNTVTNTGLQENWHKTALGQQVGTAIYSYATSGTTVMYNRVINAGYCGINFRGPNSPIKYNFIDNAMCVLGDGGGIYSYNGYTYSETASVDSEIMYNIVINTRGNRAGYINNWDDGYGIYMDARIHDLSIHYNTVHNCNVGIFLNLNGVVDVQYNKISDCTLMVHSTTEQEDCYYYNNIMYAYNRLDDYLWWTDTHQRFVMEDGATPIYDYNTYINHYNTSNIFKNSDDWTSWQAGGDDPNSTFDGSTLPAGDTEKLLYNDTKAAIDTTLTGSWKYLDGSSVAFPITIQPFESIILTGH